MSTAVNYKFLKLAVADQLIDAVDQKRKALFQDLINNATDDVIVMRRFRMLSQLNQFESQALKKIFQFNTDIPEDYNYGLSMLLTELHYVSSKNA